MGGGGGLLNSPWEGIPCPGPIVLRPGEPCTTRDWGRIRPQTCNAVKADGRELAAAAGLGAGAAGQLQGDGNFYSSPPSRMLFLPRVFFALK